MKNSQKIGFLSVLLFIVSCSTKKDAFLNRNYNALTTQYNILYNGGVAFDQGLNEINFFIALFPINVHGMFLNCFYCFLFCNIKRS